jgi:hypothetical protein
MKNKSILILGDVLALLIVTLIGFATHGETGLSSLPRLAATFIPLVIAWFSLAPWFELFDIEFGSTPTLPPPSRPAGWGRWRVTRRSLREATEEVIKVALAMLFAGPFAVVLRGLILNTPVIPIFAVVLSVTSALGIVVWRAIYFLISRLQKIS